MTNQYNFPHILNINSDTKQHWKQSKQIILNNNYRNRIKIVLKIFTLLLFVKKTIELINIPSGKTTFYKKNNNLDLTIPTFV